MHLDAGLCHARLLKELCSELSVLVDGDNFVADVNDLKLEEIVPRVVLNQFHDVSEDFTVVESFLKAFLSESDNVQDQVNSSESLLSKWVEWLIIDGAYSLAYHMVSLKDDLKCWDFLKNGFNKTVGQSSERSWV